MSKSAGRLFYRYCEENDIPARARDFPPALVTPSRGGSFRLVSQWCITVETLKKFGHAEEARKQADGCITTMLARDQEKRGTFHEYYLPGTGEPVINPNFMSWNALAALME